MPGHWAWKARKSEACAPGVAGGEGQMGPRAGDKAVPEAECTGHRPRDGASPPAGRGLADHRAVLGSPGLGPRRSSKSGA